MAGGDGRILSYPLELVAGEGGELGDCDSGPTNLSRCHLFDAYPAQFRAVGWGGPAIACDALDGICREAGGAAAASGIVAGAI